ncbi:unnamed protein product [Polarella glacialis]|uniref:PDZ domain-containing protein n=1 Tax=Polarella glacialis TaxID=89957 RepID=A0A813KPE1_POLGL|nr:unnamed protein product [Polarella glacialis]
MGFYALQLFLLDRTCRLFYVAHLASDGSASADESTDALLPDRRLLADQDWAPVIHRVKCAVVSIRVTATRPFEDGAAGVWHGTGFVVSLDPPHQALILTNRHIISTGPIQAFATFDGHEELPVYPVYRDPVHDFGFFQFDISQLRFTPATQIPLSPQGLQMGVEVLVIGNDNCEKIQILPATIARVDRNPPEYDDSNYQDENTFYAGAGSNTSGGSSGSPVINHDGACIALNAGGANEAVSAYYLPLDRVVYVLNWLQSHRSDVPLPPRGTFLTKFLFQPFDMLRRLGFTEAQEKGVLGNSLEEGAAPAGTQSSGGRSNGVGSERAPRGGNGKNGGGLKGLLVVESFLPGSEAAEKLQPGDVLLEVASDQPCFDFTCLESHLDSNVGMPIKLKVSRAGEVLSVELTSQVTSVNGHAVQCLSDFHDALSAMCDGETFEVSWYNPTTNERRQKRSSLRMERTLWPLCSWRFAPARPNTWRRSETEASASANASVSTRREGALPQVEGANPSRGIAKSNRSQDKEGEAADEGTTEAAGNGNSCHGVGSTAEGDQDLPCFPPSQDASIARWQPTFCSVTSRVAHEYATDFVHSDAELKSTLVRRWGMGVVVDAALGLVITDRYTVPQPLAHVELTFAQMFTTDAICVFVHPQHNIVLLKYDTSALKGLPVQSMELPGGNPEDGSTASSTLSSQELSVGEVLCFIGLHSDHRINAKQVSVGSVQVQSWAFAEPPVYRERNLEICNLNDTMQANGGLLVEPGSKGRLKAWFAQFPAGKKHYVAGIPALVLAGLLQPFRCAPGSPPSELLFRGALTVATLECEFQELSLAKALRYHGMSLECAKELAASCCESGRRQVLTVSRITAGGTCDQDGGLIEGDIVLKVAGQPVTRPQEVERLISRKDALDLAPVLWTVLRSKEQVEVRVQPSRSCSDGTTRLLLFNGLVLRATPRAIAERGGPALPNSQPGQGLYFWYVFPGSPADTFELAAPGWLVQVDSEPTPSIDRLLELLRSGKFHGREWLRCHIMDSEGRPTVRALKPDQLFWPTVELTRRADDAVCSPGRWVSDRGSRAATCGLEFMLSEALTQHGLPLPVPTRVPCPGAVAEGFPGGPKRWRSPSLSLSGGADVSAWLRQLHLEAYESEVEAWVSQMGAVSLKEVAENRSLLALALPLKPLEIRRLERDGLVFAESVVAGRPPGPAPVGRGPDAVSGLQVRALLECGREVAGEAAVSAEAKDEGEHRITACKVPARARVKVGQHQVLDSSAASSGLGEAFGYPKVSSVSQPPPARKVSAAGRAHAEHEESSAENQRLSQLGPWHFQRESSPEASPEAAVHRRPLEVYSNARGRVQARLRVDANIGAGISLLWCMGEGYRIEEMEDLPGQPDLQVGDIIRSIGGMRLEDASTVEDVEQRFASAFVDGVILEVQRSCFQVSLRLTRSGEAGLSLVWLPPEGYLVEAVCPEKPGQPDLRPGDVLRRVGEVTLGGHKEVPAADRALASALKDGAVVHVFRPSCDAALGDLVAVARGAAPKMRGRSEASPSSSLLLPSVGVGTWSWGNDAFGIPEAAVADGISDAFRAAVGLGSFFFDTAPSYGKQGFAERSIGRLCSEGNYAITATKHFPRAGSDLAAAMMATAREARSRLQLQGPLELMQLHRTAEPPCSLEAQADALAAVVKAGLANAVGVCNFSLEELQVVHERLLHAHGIPLSTCQVELSLARQLPVSSGLVAGCRELGISVIAYSPLAMGRLTGRYDPVRGDRPRWKGRGGESSRPFGAALDQDPSAWSQLLEALQRVGERHGRSPAQVAINWVLCQGAVAIAGARNKAQAQENAGAMGWRLSQEEAAGLAALGPWDIDPVLVREITSFMNMPCTSVEGDSVFYAFTSMRAESTEEAAGASILHWGWQALFPGNGPTGRSRGIFHSDGAIQAIRRNTCASGPPPHSTSDVPPTTQRPLRAAPFHMVSGRALRPAEGMGPSLGSSQSGGQQAQALLGPECLLGLLELLDAQGLAQLRRSGCLSLGLRAASRDGKLLPGRSSSLEPLLERLARVAELRAGALELLGSTKFPFVHASYVLGLNGPYYSCDTTAEKHYGIPSALPRLLCDLFKLEVPDTPFTSLRIQKFSAATNFNGNHRTLPMNLHTPPMFSPEPRDEVPGSEQQTFHEEDSGASGSATAFVLCVTAGCRGGHGECCDGSGSGPGEALLGGWRPLTAPMAGIRARWAQFEVDSWLRWYWPTSGDYYAITVTCEPFEHIRGLRRSQRRQMTDVGFQLPVSADDDETGPSSEDDPGCAWATPGPPGDVPEELGSQQSRGVVRLNGARLAAAKRLLGLTGVVAPTTQEIEEAFRGMVRQAHPDRANRADRASRDAGRQREISTTGSLLEETSETSPGASSGWDMAQLSWARTVLREAESAAAAAVAQGLVPEWAQEEVLPTEGAVLPALAPPPAAAPIADAEVSPNEMEQ